MTKHETFARDIEAKLLREAFDSERFLPGERALATEYGVSRVAVRMGLGVLKDKGLLEAVPGKGYRRRGAAPRPRTNLVGLVLAGSRDSGPSAEMADSVCAVLRDNGNHMLYANSMDSLTTQKAIINSLVKRGVDGLVVVPVYRKTETWQEPDRLGALEFLEGVSAGGTPVVLMDRSYDSASLPCVGNDDVAGGHLAAKHLIARGHKKILYLGCVKLDWISVKRHQGYLKAIEEAGLEPQVYPLDKFFGDKSVWDAGRRREIVRAALNSFKAASAVQTTWDIPDHIAEILADDKGIPPKECIGYDTPPVSRCPYMRRPLGMIGRMATEKLCSIIEGKEINQCDFLPPEIITPHSNNGGEHHG